MARSTAKRRASRPARMPARASAPNKAGGAAATRTALGKGLESLMPVAGEQTGAPHPGLRHLGIERLKPSPDQPRKFFDEEALAELAQSIRAQGVLQPVVVRRSGSGDYEIVAGERRWRAAQLAGLTEIPALVKELSDERALSVALIENLQREDLDPLEEAQAYARLIQEHRLTHDQVAQAVGKSRAAITNTMRLLRMPDALIGQLAKGALRPGHARALMTLPSDSLMLELSEEIIANQWSVRESERRARILGAAKRQEQAAASGEGAARAARSRAEVTVEQRLQRYLSAKVRLSLRQGKGKIEVHFSSLDELDRLLARIMT